jgi:hypothetical protein
MAGAGSNLWWGYIRLQSRVELADEKIIDVVVQDDHEHLLHHLLLVELQHVQNLTHVKHLCDQLLNQMEHHQLLRLNEVFHFFLLPSFFEVAYKRLSPSKETEDKSFPPDAIILKSC